MGAPPLLDEAPAVGALAPAPCAVPIVVPEAVAVEVLVPGALAPAPCSVPKVVPDAIVVPDAVAAAAPEIDVEVNVMDIEDIEEPADVEADNIA